MTRRTASILLVGLFFSGLSLGQTPSVQRLVSAKNEETRRGSKEQEDVEHLSRTIDRVERAFEAGDPDELEGCLSEKRIYLSLKARGEEAGYYGRSQVKFMLAKLFRERRTDSFTYDPEDIEVSRGESAAFRAEWSYLAVEVDDVVTEQLRFKLERAKGPEDPKGDDWRVSEIRAQSR
jgi:hypothetical protein